MSPRITGLVAAAFTPFRPDGSLDLERVPRLVDHLADHGVAGVYALGSTGQGVALTGEERRQVASAFVEAARGRLPVIVQVGHESLREARALAAHAQEIGAYGVSAVAPTYFRPSSVEALVESMAEVASGAPELPFFYYHVPGLTGVALSMVEFLCHGSERIPTLAGLKYTSPTLHEYQRCLELDDGRFQVFFGVDEMLLAGLAVGARAAVGSTYNFAAPVYRQLWQAFERGDLEEARRWQSRSHLLVETIFEFGARASQKAILALIGLDCGPCRLPVVDLDGSEREELRAELEALGFFDWIRGGVAAR